MDSSNTIVSYTFENGCHADGLPTFLTLPVELRLEVYAYLLRLIEPCKGFSPSEKPEVHPQILSVCRKIHFEAHTMLYRLNVFLAHPSLLTSFPRLRQKYSPIASSTMVSLIRSFKLRVRLDAGPGFTRETATKAFSGLDSVEIEVWQAAYRGAGRDVLELFEDIRGVRRARITGSTSGFEEYAAWLEKSMMSSPGQGLGVKYDGVAGDVSVAWRTCLFLDCNTP